MNSSNDLTASDVEDKTATLTLDGNSSTAEADQWLRDNGVILPVEPAPSAYAGAAGSSTASASDSQDPSVPSRPPRRRERKKSSPPSPKVISKLVNGFIDIC